MNILAHVHVYLPRHNAGAERMLHSVFSFFKKKGHTCKVLASVYNNQKWNFEGVDVIGHSKNNDDLYKWADVVITHLDLSPTAVKLSRTYRKPIIHLVHNHWQMNNVKVEDADLVVFNTWAIFNLKIRPWIDSIVVHPPLFRNKFLVDRPNPQYITLINLTEIKGPNTFYECAARLPNIKFLGVKGCYGQQIVKNLPNVKIIKHESDIRKVYKDTKILLLPSRYDSYGCVLTEAASNGIPSISEHFLGVKEALGDVAISRNRFDINGYVEEINKLYYDQKHYLNISSMFKKRAEYLEKQSIDELNRFEQKLLKLNKKVSSLKAG